MKTLKYKFYEVKREFRLKIKEQYIEVKKMIFENEVANRTIKNSGFDDYSSVVSGNNTYNNLNC